MCFGAPSSKEKLEESQRLGKIWKYALKNQNKIWSILKTNGRIKQKCHQSIQSDSHVRYLNENCSD